MTKIEPVWWSVTCNGLHVGNMFPTENQATEKMIDLDASYKSDIRTVERLYSEAQMRQAMEACAAVCDPLGICANERNELIKEMLP